MPRMSFGESTEPVESGWWVSDTNQKRLYKRNGLILKILRSLVKTKVILSKGADKTAKFLTERGSLGSVFEPEKSKTLKVMLQF